MRLPPRAPCSRRSTTGIARGPCRPCASASASMLARRGPGPLERWRLSCNKARMGRPANGAANIVATADGVVLGTLNEMPAQGLAVLDRFEGVATRQYRRETVTVVRADTGALVEATTYVALNIGSDSLLPLGEYLAHLLAGRDLLPADYCALLDAQRVAD